MISWPGVNPGRERILFNWSQGVGTQRTRIEDGSMKPLIPPGVFSLISEGDISETRPFQESVMVANLSARATTSEAPPFVRTSLIVS